MTAKPVPEYISDERLAEMLAAAEKATPRLRERRVIDASTYRYVEDAEKAVARDQADADLNALCDPATILALLTELQHRREAEAGTPDGWVLVPKAAIDWLNGEAPDPAGMEFGEFTDDYPKPAGAFWWRKVFRQICEFYAAQRPLAASPSSPASGVRVKATHQPEDQVE